MANTSATAGYLVPTSPDIIDGDSLVDTITDAVAGITGLDGALVRPKWQPKGPKRPAATVDFCEVGITDDKPDAGPVIAHDPNANGGDGQDTYLRQYELVALASFYGPNAQKYARLLADGLGMPQNLETLKQNSLTFVAAGTLRALPESINMVWVTRYDLMLYFRRSVSRAYAILTIETAGVELHTDDEVTQINVTP